MRTLLATLALLGAATFALADGGVVLSRGVVGGLEITVFASPVPLRAGPADISVLVQEQGKPAAVLDAAVDMAWSAAPDAFPQWMPPCCSMTTGDTIPATQAHSQNKMLYSAMVPIKSSGPSKLLVKVVRDGKTVTLPCELNAGPASSPMLAYWPCLAFPPFLIFGFVLHQRLSGSRRKEPSSIEER